MQKKQLIAALEEFDDDDHIQIGDEACSFTPKITKICGKRQEFMPYYCVLEPGHDGDCYCSCKLTDFTPD